MKKKICSVIMGLLVSVAMQAQVTPVSQMEKLGRGVVALASSGSGKFVSWRFLGTDDPARTTFNVIRNGVVIKEGLTVTKPVGGIKSVRT